MSYTGIAVIAAFVAGVAIGALACERMQEPRVIQHTEKIVHVPGYTDSVRIESLPVVVRVPVGAEGVDSSVVASLIAERDSLRSTLVSMGVRVSFTADTTTANGNRYIVECDETTRTARLIAHIAPVDTVIRDTTDVLPVVIEPSAWGLSVGGGAAISVDGVIRPAAFVGITYTFFRR